MSKDSQAIDGEHMAYVAAHTRGDDPFLIRLKEAALKAEIPEIWIAPAQASCIQILLKLMRARTVVEVGTLAGYSSIWMARAIRPEGTVSTIEISPSCASFAKEWIARSDVAGSVRVLEGSATDRLREFDDSSVDAIFIDADKVNYGHYLDEALRIVRKGGLIMVDNAFAFGFLLDSTCTEEDVHAIREFNRRIASEPRLQSVLMPLGDGFWVGVKND